MDRRRSFRPERLFLLLLLTIALVAATSVASIGKLPNRGQFVRVKVKRANVRSGPGTKYRKVWTAPRNYPYQVIRRKGRWLKVEDYAGYEEWIYGPLTDRRPAVVVKVGTANVRKGPGLKYPFKFSAEEGVPFRVLTRKKKWVKVRHADGDEGWIFANLVWGKLP